MQHFGLDFGTTNSSLAWAGADRSVTLCALDPDAGDPHVLRSLLYYSPERRGFVVGRAAIDEYLAEDMRGTLMQSIKTFLGDDSFETTWVNDRPYRLEELIAVIFQHVRRVIRSLTQEDARLVIGRPAVFVQRPEKEELARQRLRIAAGLAGFAEVDFLYEPIAAGLAYEATLEQPEVALIADFGGGTSDFTVMRLGSGNRGDRREDILASGGVQIGGDTFDARIMTRKLASHFGGGTTFRSMEGKDLPFPKHLLTRLGMWHQVPFLRSPRTRDLLSRIEWSSSHPRAVAAFRRLIDGNYSFFLFQEIERAKSRVSVEEEAEIRFREEEIDISEILARSEFQDLIAGDRSEVTRCMDTVLAAAGVRREQVQAVFLTGGSAQIPVIRRMFAEQFGEEKLKARDYLTTVAVGLGLAAGAHRDRPAE